MTNIIFMGTPDFSATVLKGLLESKQYEILAVVTQPDRAVGRKKEIRMTPVKELALDYGLPIYQPEKLSKSAELDSLLNLNADGIVTAAFGQFLPSKLLDWSILPSMCMLRCYQNIAEELPFTTPLSMVTKKPV